VGPWSGVERKGVDVPAVGAIGVAVVALAALAVLVRADGVNENDGLLCSTGVRNPAGNVSPVEDWGTWGTYSEHSWVLQSTARVRLRGFVSLGGYDYRGGDWVYIPLE